jgi:hypothetical protein
MQLSLDSPLALYSIPLAWLTVVYPSSMRTGAIRQLIGFDNTLPRQNITMWVLALCILGLYLIVVQA